MRPFAPSCLLLGCAALVLTGCSANFGALPPSPATGFAITGAAHGGRQPIVAAHVYLLEANTVNYAGPGIAADSSGASTDNSSKSLLTSGDGTDAIGTYVLTHSDGSFSVSNDYTCDTGDQVYLYALGGMPDGVNQNTSAGLMAVLGTCGTDFNASTSVNMNELSTIAAAYAFSGFATDATHVGAPSSTDALAATGIVNAFATAQQLFDISTNPYSSPPSGSDPTKYGNGHPNYLQVNTLANILSACINSSDGSQCSTLFGDLESAGTSGTEATDTATEAIYIAHNQSITSIYSVTGSGPNPYGPWHSAVVPVDFSISIIYLLDYNGAGIEGLAIDAAGNVWATEYEQPGSIVECNNLGVLNSNSPMTGGGIDGPSGIAIDSLGNAWVANFYGSSMTDIATSASPYTISTVGSTYGESVAIGLSNNVWLTSGDQIERYSNSGSLLKATTFSGVGVPIAIDPSGNAWVGDFANSRLDAFNSSDVLTFTSATTNGLGSPYGAAIDHYGDIWVANNDSDSVSEFTSTGAVAGSSPFSLGYTQTAVAVDGSNNIWLASSNILELSNSGALLSTAAGYPTGNTRPLSIAVDGSGNVWTGTVGIVDTVVTELVGAATPVTTPLATGVQNNTLGTRP